MSEPGGTWLVVGLGNPGPRYAPTRHNVGYLVTQLLADRAGARWRAHKSGHADVVEDRIGDVPGVRVVLARARTYMNESGGPVSTLAKFYKIDPDHIVAIHDELDVDYGALRVKYGGGDNGHNGLRSMRQSLGTGDFYRVRFGIGRPQGRQQPVEYVLKPFSATERRELDVSVEYAADAVESLLTVGLERTQSSYNS